MCASSICRFFFFSLYSRLRQHSIRTLLNITAKTTETSQNMETVSKIKDPITANKILTFCLNFFSCRCMPITTCSDKQKKNKDAAAKKRIINASIILNLIILHCLYYSLFCRLRQVKKSARTKDKKRLQINGKRIYSIKK